MARAIMGGTEEMRQHERYLPKHPAESDGVYRQRIKKAFLDNFVGMAIEKANGKIFSQEIAVADLPPEIETLIENIDRQGRSLNAFIMDVSAQAFCDGISFAMVDMPRKPEGAVTLAEEQALGLRPYAVHVKPSSVLETLSEMIGGVETLTRVRIKECVSVPDAEWGYTEIEQVRVWYKESGLVRWELYRQGGEFKAWVMVDQGFTTFKNIYLIPFYTNRTGFMEGLPPFQNIAESTVEHWQWKSEHAHALSMCCFGMYTATGVPEEFAFQVGPAKTQTCTSPDAKFGVLETSGEGVTLAENALKAIESRIESAGVSLRVENAGTVTATAAALDSDETNAGLKAVAHGFSNSIEQMVSAFAEILGVDIGNAEVEVNDDFGTKKGSDAGLVELGKARALGDISRKQYLDTLLWRGELPEDFDIDANEEELSSEAPAMGSIGSDNTEAAV
jgi:hypothetical protein